MTVLETMDKTAKIAIECKHCGDVELFVVRNTQLKAYREGECPHDAFPLLSLEACDFIGSDTCTTCSNKGLK